MTPFDGVCAGLELIVDFVCAGPLDGGGCRQFAANIGALPDAECVGGPCPPDGPVGPVPPC